MRRYKMERVYYDIADNFVKDLEKKLNKSIEINEKENKIKIDEIFESNLDFNTKRNKFL